MWWARKVAGSPPWRARPQCLRRRPEHTRTMSRLPGTPAAGPARLLATARARRLQRSDGDLVLPRERRSLWAVPEPGPPRRLPARCHREDLNAAMVGGELVTGRRVTGPADSSRGCTPGGFGTDHTAAALPDPLYDA